MLPLTRTNSGFTSPARSAAAPASPKNVRREEYIGRLYAVEQKLFQPGGIIGGMPAAMDLFSDDLRRNPFPAYEYLRSASPLLRVPPPFNGWMIFDYDSVKWALNDNATFSSRVPAPPNWFLFDDPPSHTKLRGLIARAFTPRMIANLEPRIRELSRELLDAAAQGV